MQGAANVRCSQCQHITPVAAAAPAMRPPAGPSMPPMTQQLPSAQRAQLQCAGCQVMLMYPRGANNVQCAVCGVVSSAAQARLLPMLCGESKVLGRVVWKVVPQHPLPPLTRCCAALLVIATRSRPHAQQAPLACLGMRSMS